MTSNQTYSVKLRFFSWSNSLEENKIGHSSVTNSVVSNNIQNVDGMQIIKYEIK